METELGASLQEGLTNDRRVITYGDLFGVPREPGSNALPDGNADSEALMGWLTSDRQHVVKDMHSLFWLNHEIEATIGDLNRNDELSKFELAYNKVMHIAGQRLLAEFPPLVRFMEDVHTADERKLTQSEKLIRSGVLRAEIMQQYSTDPLGGIHSEYSDTARREYRRGEHMLDEETLPANVAVVRPSLALAEDMLNICVRELDPTTSRRYELKVSDAGGISILTEEGAIAKLVQWDGIDLGPTEDGMINIGASSAYGLDCNIASGAIIAVLWGYGSDKMCKDERELAEVIFGISPLRSKIDHRFALLRSVRQRVGLDIYPDAQAAAPPRQLQRSIDFSEVGAVERPYEKAIFKSAGGRLLIDDPKFLPADVDYMVPGIVVRSEGKDKDWGKTDPYDLTGVSLAVAEDDVAYVADQLKQLGLEDMSQAFLGSVREGALSVQDFLNVIGAYTEYHYNVGANGRAFHVSEFGSFVHDGKLVGNCSAQAEFGAALLRMLRIQAQMIPGYAINADGRPVLPHAQLMISPSEGAGDHYIADPTLYCSRNVGPEIPAELSSGNIITRRKRKLAHKMGSAIMAMARGSRQPMSSDPSALGDESGAGYSIETLVTETVTDTFVSRWHQWLECNFAGVKSGRSLVGGDARKDYIAAAVLESVSEASLVRRVSKMIGYATRGDIDKLQSELVDVRKTISLIRSSYANSASGVQVKARNALWGLPDAQLDALEHVLSALSWYRA